MGAREVLKLFQCICDTGTEVVCICAKSKLLTRYGGNFAKFLDDEKHFLFHQLDGIAPTCCLCPPTGRPFTKVCKMDKWKFEQIYDDSGNIVPGDLIKNKRQVQQECIHKYVSKNVKIENLDISVIVFLLKNCARVSRQEDMALKKLIELRNKICHLNNTDGISLPEINSMWSDLEASLLDLVDPAYRAICKTAIKSSQRINLERSEIDELEIKIAAISRKIGEDNQVLTQHAQCVVTEFNKFATEQKSFIEETLRNNNVHISSVVNTLSNQLIGVLENQNVMMRKIELLAQKPLENNNSELKTIKMRAELTAQSLNDKAENAVMENLLTKEDIAAGTSKDEVKRNLPSPIPDSNDEMEILKKKKNCILLELAANPQIFTSTDALRSAILKLIRKVLDAGNVDASITDTIYVQMSFDTPLTQSQYGVVLELMSYPYTERLEPKSEQLRQIKSESIDIGEATCRLCIEKIKEIALLKKTITEKEEENSKQIEDIKLQKQQIENQKNLLDGKIQTIKEQTKPIPQIAEELLSGKPKHKSIESLQSQYEYQIGERPGKIIPLSSLQIRSDLKLRDEIGEMDLDALKRSSSYLTSRQNKYDIKCGKVIIDGGSFGVKEGFTRIEERFVKFPNFTVEHNGMYNRSETLEQVDFLIMILGELGIGGFRYDILKRVLLSVSERQFPVVIITSSEVYVTWRLFMESIYLKKQDFLLVGIYEGKESRYSLLHHLADAMENMKDGDDFAAILYDVSRKCIRENKDNRHLFYSNLRKDLILS